MFNWIKKLLFGSKVVVVEEEATQPPIQAPNEAPITTLEITPAPENPVAKRKDECADVEQRPTKQVKRDDDEPLAKSVVIPTKKPSTTASPVPVLEKKPRE